MSAVDYWLQIEGVETESQDEVLEDSIQLESWEWGEKNRGSWSINGGGGQGKVEMSDFKFTMWLNKASPKLFLMCATGEHIPSAKLTCRKAGGGQQVFFEVDFLNLSISSFETIGDGMNVHPRNKIAFNFESIEVNYMEQSDDGTLGATTTAGYDLKRNQKL
jgi:type VI secretion system secreted protein Hcp